MFALSASPDPKDLDVAYRKLARTMHPDKNGGTEAAQIPCVIESNSVDVFGGFCWILFRQEAKEQFQTMRASYEESMERCCR